MNQIWCCIWKMAPNISNLPINVCIVKIDIGAI